MTNITKEDYKAIAQFYKNEVENWRQFNKCQAWISNRIYNSAFGIEFSLVKSYNTVVAVIDHSNGKFVRLGKWSTTTSKQSTQIHNSFYRYYENIQL